MNAHAFQPNRGKKIKERDKSALESAVGAALAGACTRCQEQLKWCAVAQPRSAGAWKERWRRMRGSARGGGCAARRRGGAGALTRAARRGAQEAQVRKVPAGGRRAAVVRAAARKAAPQRAHAQQPLRACVQRS